MTVRSAPPNNFIDPPATKGLGQTWSLTKESSDWLRDVASGVDQATSILPNGIAATGQHASITTTNLPLTTTASATYRVSWFVHITTAAVTSSSVTVVLGATDGGVPYTQSGVAVTGNTTATTGSGMVIMASDQASPLTYAVTYASNGAGEAQYTLVLVTEAL